MPDTYTVQKHGEVEPQIGGLHLPIIFSVGQDIAPEWDAVDRDAYLRVFWKRFGNDMLQAVLSTVIAKVQTQNWEVEGPESLAKMYHRIIRDESDFNRGYDILLARGLLDYYTQDNGWFMERQRSGPKNYDGPALGFAHLDAARMRPTGNTEFPYTYEDIYGEYHLMHYSQFIRIVDMPASRTALYDDQKGFCALSRTLSTAMILTMIIAMKRERLADLPPSALAIFNNINRKQFNTALRLKGAEDDMKNNMIYRQLLPLFGIDPAHPASVQFLSLRDVWEGYSDQTQYDISAYSFAAGFRIDPREFWPVSQGPLGTGKEAEVQHQKAKGKGHGLIFTQVERGFNSDLSLPPNVQFKYAMQDIEEEEQKAQIHAVQIGNIKAMQEAGAGLTPEEVRYILVTRHKILPKELLNPPAEGESVDYTHADVYLDDVERQVKEFGGWWFGPVVKINDAGAVVRVNGAKKELPDGPLFIGQVPPPSVVMAAKGGAGSGNWGHAGRPGLRGGSSSRSGGQARLGATKRRLKLARLSREEREREKQEAEDAALEVQRMIEQRQAEHAERVKPVEKPDLAVEKYEYTQVVDRADQIQEGKFGKGYFIREDGKLVDITGDFGGGTNDHVGFMVFSEHPELVGVSKITAANLRQLTNDLYVEEKWGWGGKKFLEMEQKWYDDTLDAWGEVFGAGNTRVREYGTLGGSFKGQTVVGIDGNLPQNNDGIKQIQNWVLAGKMGRADVYSWESHAPGGGYLDFSYEDLMRASNVNDLKIGGKELENPIIATKEALLSNIRDDDFTCCPSHAAQLFPSIVDRLHELDLISTEEAYASALVPDNVPFALAKAIKETSLTGDQLLQETANELRYQLQLQEFSLGQKESQALKTINQKIASLPGPVATQVRQASAGLKDSMLTSSKRRLQAVRDIPDEIWAEAVRKDELANQPDHLDVVQNVVQTIAPGIKEETNGNRDQS